MQQEKPLTAETVGHFLDEDTFPDLYEQVWNQGNRYFARPGENDHTDLIIVFQDIEDFSASTESKIVIDFKRHKDKLFLIVWTLTDPENPLGFPIPFEISDPVEMQRLESILSQEKVWIHSLAVEKDDQFIHIFSEAYELPEAERNIEKLQENLSSTEEEQEEAAPEEVDANQLTDQQLTQMGFGYALDFSSMIAKQGEQEAQEHVMSAVLQAITMIKYHPQANIRTSQLLVWVSQQNERTAEGELAQLLTVYISSEHEELFQLWTSARQEADPFGAVFLSLPQFLTTLREKPLEKGSYPIMEFKAGELRHLQLSDQFRLRLASLWNGQGANPYLAEEQ
ncbi:hypothetical protein BEP19_06490 [Ammoniphilus oxalaticus]|uniref:Uncharacterized protein n=1 Tax=Ammoniphilus oxalaticus TaxID=66863 RepID=A0A419SJB9_9BACL|nr:hypothetical protein [Ammoniphilus oxalaticus]RKD24052.1 hypothetical protein BEP19_06490 [Ammoniphilus oxalaticus]